MSNNSQLAYNLGDLRGLKPQTYWLLRRMGLDTIYKVLKFTVARIGREPQVGDATIKDIMRATGGRLDLQWNEQKYDRMRDRVSVSKGGWGIEVRPLRRGRKPQTIKKCIGCGTLILRMDPEEQYCSPQCEEGAEIL